jgi:flagellar hook-length control protein FliK
LSVRTDGDETQAEDLDNTDLQTTPPQTIAARAGGSEGSPSPDAPASTPSAGQTPTLDAAFAAPLQTPIVGSVPSAAAPPASISSYTVADLANQTAGQVGSGANQFQITLTPEGLGQVSVTVSVAAEGKVSAAFAFERPETAEALSGRASDLQKALEQAGFTLSDSGLSFAVATPATHGQGAGSQQNPDGGLGQGGAGQGFSQGGSGQGGSGQGSNPGSNTAFTQAANQGSGQGDGGAQNGGSQGRSWTYGQAGALAFAAASDATEASLQSSYASRSTSGLDIRI